MANQRPIRTPRTPRWRRGRFTPRKTARRWIDCNSSRASETGLCDLNASFVDCDDTNSYQPLAILLDGDADWDWADSSEVRVDRIIGSLSWYHAFTAAASGATIGQPPPITMRWAVLATEENHTTTPNIDLFDPENLEEYQWMWLSDSIGNLSHAGNSLWQYNTESVDISTRRSLGKKDRVLLYAQYKYLLTPQAGGTGLQPRMWWQLRSILRS